MCAYKSKFYSFKWNGLKVSNLNYKLNSNVYKNKKIIAVIKFKRNLMMQNTTVKDKQELQQHKIYRDVIKQVIRNKL